MRTIKRFVANYHVHYISLVHEHIHSNEISEYNAEPQQPASAPGF